MDHQEIANRAGVSLTDIESLLRGDCSMAVAARLKVAPTDIEDFIRGSATHLMTKRLGLEATSATEELAKAAKREGAIGIVIGLLLAR